METTETTGHALDDGGAMTTGEDALGFGEGGGGAAPEDPANQLDGALAGDGDGHSAHSDEDATAQEPPAQQPVDTTAGPDASLPVVNKEGEPVGTPAEATAGSADGTPGNEQDEKTPTVRLYKLLYLTGVGQWTEISLPEPGPANPWVVMSDGEKMAQARNTDHARRLAFAALDRPTQGAQVVVVARTGWQPKTVKPAAPKPDRERLEIS